MAISYQTIDRYDIDLRAAIAHVYVSHPVEGQPSLFVPDPEPGETELYEYPFGLVIEIDSMDAGRIMTLTCGTYSVELERDVFFSYSSGNLPYEDFPYDTPVSLRVRGGWEVPPLSLTDVVATPEPLTGVTPDLSVSLADPVPVSREEDFVMTWDPGYGDRVVIVIMTEDGVGNFLELLRHAAYDEAGTTAIPQSFIEGLTPGSIAKILIARKNAGTPVPLLNGGLAESETVVAIRGVGVVE